MAIPGTTNNKCPYCKDYVHHLMPWMRDWKRVKSGKYKGRLAHRRCNSKRGTR